MASITIVINHIIIAMPDTVICFMSAPGSEAIVLHAPVIQLYKVVSILHSHSDGIVVASNIIRSNPPPISGVRTGAMSTFEAKKYIGKEWK